MKKLITILSAVLLCAAFVWFIGSGFTVNSSVYITDDFTVSPAGDAITFTVGTTSSMGFVRAYKDEGGGSQPHYLKFYAAWGGFNSALGAKSTYTLPLAPTDNAIYIYRGSAGYTPALQKTDDGQWHTVK